MKPEAGPPPAARRGKQQRRDRGAKNHTNCDQHTSILEDTARKEQVRSSLNRQRASHEIVSHARRPRAGAPPSRNRRDQHDGQRTVGKASPKQRAGRHQV